MFLTKSSKTLTKININWQIIAIFFFLLSKHNIYEGMFFLVDFEMNFSIRI